MVLFEFSDIVQMTSKCGRDKKMAHEAQPSVLLMFPPHFDLFWCSPPTRLFSIGS